MKILIEAFPREGKTAISQEIYRHLRSLGLNVELNDFEKHEHMLVPDPENFQRLRIQALREKQTFIGIDSKQIQREPK